MNVALLTARFVLAAVFAVAGVTKLLDRRGSQQAVVDFGLPEALAEPVALLLPIAELGVAVGLVPGTTAQWASVGAIVLIALFLTGIITNLARGQRPDCHCFGQLHSAPLGPLTVIRNVVLAGLATFVVASGGPSPATWWNGLSAVGRMGFGVGGGAGVLIALEGSVLAALFLAHGRTLLRLDELEGRLAGSDHASVHGRMASLGLPVGSPAPEFTLPGLHGETSTLGALRSAGHPILLVFTDPACLPCQTLIPEIAGWQQAMGGRLTISVISRGPVKDNLAKFVSAGISGVLIQDDQEVAVSYRYGGTPGAVLVTADGTIASEVAAGPDAIRHLVASADGSAAVPVVLGRDQNGSAQPPAGPGIGEPAPPVRLPDLEGNTVDMGTIDGRDRFVLFWDPGCGFCQDVLPQLREWEQHRTDGAPEAVLISKGSTEANRDMNLTSQVLIDDTFSVARAFGAHGTPIAVRIDREGHISSELAVGGSAVMELFRSGTAPSS